MRNSPKHRRSAWGGWCDWPAMQCPAQAGESADSAPAGLASSGRRRATTTRQESWPFRVRRTGRSRGKDGSGRRGGFGGRPSRPGHSAVERCRGPAGSRQAILPARGPRAGPWRPGGGGRRWRPGVRVRGEGTPPARSRLGVRRRRAGAGAFGPEGGCYSRASRRGSQGRRPERRGIGSSPDNPRHCLCPRACCQAQCRLAPSFAMGPE